MTTSLGIGIIAIAMAVVAFAYVMLEPDFMKLRSEQMRAEDKGTKSDEAEESTPVFDAINGLLDRLGWKGFSEEQLAEAGIKVGRNRAPGGHWCDSPSTSSHIQFVLGFGCGCSRAFCDQSLRYSANE